PKGRGVCLIKAGTTSPSFTMKGSAKVDQNNDVYLTDGTKITVNGALNPPQGGKAACITPQTYTGGTQVLDGSTVSSEHDKFTVTPEDSTQWFVDSSGNLTKINHTVTFSVEGGTGGSLKGTYNGTEKTASGSSMETLTVSNGASVNFTAMPSVGYEVESWTVSPSGSISGGNPGETTASLNNITENKTVKVKFKKKTYVVTFKVDGGQGTLQGTYNGTSQITSGGETKTLIVPHGDSVTFTATPDNGYEVESWTGVTATPSNNTAATLNNITENKTVTVKFKKKTYTVTFKVDGGQGSLKGEYNGSSQTASVGNTQTLPVQHGGNVTFTAMPNEGWIVEKWTGVTATPPNGTTATLSNVTAPATVTVKFKDNIEISGNTSGAWKALKEEAAKPHGASTIVIDGTIKATSASGDNGEITIGRSLT
ncbi:InlB B-repeat-containing protein, partial [Treponema pedis]